MATMRSLLAVALVCKTAFAAVADNRTEVEVATFPELETAILGAIENGPTTIYLSASTIDASLGTYKTGIPVGCGS